MSYGEIFVAGERSCIQGLDQDPLYLVSVDDGGGKMNELKQVLNTTHSRWLEIKILF